MIAFMEPRALLPDQEFADRLDRLQAMMAAHGFDALICFGAHPSYAPADIWYLARWTCVDEEMAFLFVPGHGETVLVTDAEWDKERARDEAFAGSVVFDPTGAQTLIGLIRDNCKPGGRIGISGLGVFPAPAYLLLASELEGHELADATWLTETQRSVKSSKEVDLLREAARISDLGMMAGIDAAKEGATEFDVAAAAECDIRAHGADISFTTIVGSGARTALTTFLPTGRRLSRGDIVVLDCGARVCGYHGDMCRAVVVGGRPSADQRRILEAVRDAVEAGIDAVRPGARVRDVQGAARQAIEEAGFGEHFWGYYMPHGAGTAQHERPLGLKHGDVELEAGMVLCIEPGVALPGVGGVVLEQMIHVADRGAELLTKLPLALWE